ncbi:oligopeptide ABC transporter substrate-binding protein [uncultured Vagococcus sp.]|uniref:oligopeptide ABC transporter substrate-binding protein n=1 Tax=uncultured Vagococcus sp. TaxID=189676 RepID=UPI0028D18F82|nr:oligopeptide ABC transporter substrate-binding protein [uncultured Vagococcus sp.]
MKKALGLVTLVSVLALGLAACGSKDSADKGSKDKETPATEETAQFPSMIENKDEALDGGTLKVALPYDAQFQGVFSQALLEDAYDNFLMEPAEQYLFNTGDDFRYTDTGLATPDFDVDNKKVTITLKDDLKWSDGEAITTDDIIFPYEVIGNKAYTGVRYDDRLGNIVGMADYHDGKADTISGIKKVDDKVVEITYKEMNPSIEFGSGLIQYVMPKHQLKDIAIDKLVESDEIRKNPVTTGPYKITSVKTGESVEYTANEHYFKGKPKLDKMTITVVPTSTIADELKAKKFDIAMEMPSDNFASYKSIDGYQNVGREELYYSYIGFKFGKFDKEKGENVSDPKAKMADKALREAIAYSIDTKQLGEKIYAGLRTEANSVIVPGFKGAHDKSLEAFEVDVDKAKKILDDAGYKDTNDDGFVEDKDGKELVINFAAMDGGSSAQTVADYYKQSMKNIGLKVEFTSGRLIELNSFYDKLLGDADDVDMYAAAWSVGTDPNPSESFGRTAQFNMMRFTSDEMDAALKDIASEKSFDEKHSNAAYKEFQRIVKDEIPVIPVNYNYRVTVVNDRVKDYNYSYYTTEEVPNNWFPVSVTAEKTK